MPSSISISSAQTEVAKGMKKYLDSSPEPHHAVKTTVAMLLDEDFKELDERVSWAGKLKPGGRYFFQRDAVLGSSLVAFVVGGSFSPENNSAGGFKVLGAHTDSPNLRIKPRSERKAGGCLQLDVETYGGGLWHTWFDRDLSVAGKVIVRTPSGGLEQKLVDLERPILRIPNLAIHLQTPQEREAFKVNKEDHLQPILATEVKKGLDGPNGVVSGWGEGEAKDSEDPTVWQRSQSPLLLSLIASKLDISPSDIHDFTLSLYDVQSSSFSGAYSEFLTSSRLDNLFGCFTTVESLLTHCRSGSSKDDGDISVVALFDHEEVGSSSTVGAGSTLINDCVKRISRALEGGEDREEARIRRSMVVSFDMAHALHPNYSSKHEKYHSPKLNDGVVIKTNSNQRYASNLVTSFISREVGRVCGQDVQEFVVRNDCACGSTIGPIISALTGMQAVDVGTPQLSMHSVREMAGVKDVGLAVDWMAGFLKHYRRIDSSINSATTAPSSSE